MYDSGQEGFNHFAIFGGDYLSYSVGSSTLVVNLSTSTVAVAYQTAKR